MTTSKTKNTIKKATKLTIMLLSSAILTIMASCKQSNLWFIDDKTGLFLTHDLSSIVSINKEDDVVLIDLLVNDVDKKVVEQKEVTFEIRFADNQVYRITPFYSEPYTTASGTPLTKVQQLIKLTNDPSFIETREGQILNENFKYYLTHARYDETGYCLINNDNQRLAIFACPGNGMGINIHKAASNNKSFMITCKELDKTWKFSKEE